MRFEYFMKQLQAWVLIRLDRFYKFINMLIISTHAKKLYNTIKRIPFDFMEFEHHF